MFRILFVGAMMLCGCMAEQDAAHEDIGEAESLDGTGHSLIEPCAIPILQVDGRECKLSNGSDGYCLGGVCSVCTGCDDGNECTLDACTAVGCSHYPYSTWQSCAAGHCVINSYTSPDSALCIANGLCLDQDTVTKIVAPVAVCSNGNTCGVYSGQCGSI